jgi:hypothetical protein
MSILCRHLNSASFLIVALLFIPRMAVADSQAVISAIGKDSVCVAIGDFTKDYAVGESVEILSLGKVPHGEKSSSWNHPIWRLSSKKEMKNFLFARGT